MVMNACGPLLDESGKGLTRSQGWSGIVRTDTRAFAAVEDERRIHFLQKERKKVLTFTDCPVPVHRTVINLKGY